MHFRLANYANVISAKRFKPNEDFIVTSLYGSLFLVSRFWFLVSRFWFLVYGLLFFGLNIRWLDEKKRETRNAKQS